MGADTQLKTSRGHGFADDEKCRLNAVSTVVLDHEFESPLSEVPTSLFAEMVFSRSVVCQASQTSFTINIAQCGTSRSPCRSKHKKGLIASFLWINTTTMRRTPKRIVIREKLRRFLSFTFMCMAFRDDTPPAFLDRPPLIFYRLSFEVIIDPEG